MVIWYYILIGVIAGSLGRIAIRRGGLGLIGNILISIPAAVAGGWAFSHIGIINFADLFASLVVASITAFIALYLVDVTMKKA